MSRAGCIRDNISSGGSSPQGAHGELHSRRHPTPRTARHRTAPLAMKVLRTAAPRRSVSFTTMNTVFAMAPATPSLTSLPGKGLVTDPRHWKHPDANNAAYAVMRARWLQAERARPDSAVIVDAPAELDACARQPRNTHQAQAHTDVRARQAHRGARARRESSRQDAREAGVFCISATMCLRSERAGVACVWHSRQPGAQHVTSLCSWLCVAHASVRIRRVRCGTRHGQPRSPEC